MYTHAVGRHVAMGVTPEHGRVLPRPVQNCLNGLLHPVHVGLAVRCRRVVGRVGVHAEGAGNQRHRKKRGGEERGATLPQRG